MNFEKLTYDEVADISVDELVDKSIEAEKKLSGTEKDVYEAIADKIDDYPLNLFQKSNDELTEMFGGHDDVVVTDNVREALFWFKASIGMIDAISDRLNEICDDAGVDDEE